MEALSKGRGNRKLDSKVAVGMSSEGIVNQINDNRTETGASGMLGTELEKT